MGKLAPIRFDATDRLETTTVLGRRRLRPRPNTSCAGDVPYHGNFDSGLIMGSCSQRLAPEHDPAHPISYFVSGLLALARERGVEEPVAVHLVGASLQVRFPNLRIRNTAQGSLEAEWRRIGDFAVGDTIFSVYVFPTRELFEQCIEGFDDGKQVYLVNPSPLVPGTFLAAEHFGAGRFVVTSVEDFVSLSVDTMGEFAVVRSNAQLKRLLEIYNQRVAEVEADKSLLIEMPKELR